MLLLSFVDELLVVAAVAGAEPPLMVEVVLASLGSDMPLDVAAIVLIPPMLFTDPLTTGSSFELSRTSKSIGIGTLDTSNCSYLAPPAESLPTTVLASTR